jgi:TonB family protein
VFADSAPWDTSGERIVIPCHAALAVLPSSAEVDELTIKNLPEFIKRQRRIRDRFQGIAPVPVSQRLRYPDEAARKRIEGYVWIEFWVNNFGQTEGARVVASYPKRIFDNRVLADLQQASYIPATNYKGERTTFGPIMQRATFEFVEGEGARAKFEPPVTARDPNMMCRRRR